jgi:hypothetical protein
MVAHGSVTGFGVATAVGLLEGLVLVPGVVGELVGDALSSMHPASDRTTSDPAATTARARMTGFIKPVLQRGKRNPG